MSLELNFDRKVAQIWINKCFFVDGSVLTVKSLPHRSSVLYFDCFFVLQ
jgi:hypothetical protein